VIYLSEGSTRLTLDGNDKEIGILCREMRYHPAGYEYSPKYKAFQLTEGREGWNGYISPVKFMNTGGAQCLRGYKNEILNICSEKEIKIDTTKCLVSPFAEITADDVPDDIIYADYKLDQFQREGIVHWLKNGMGINKIAVAGGKTALIGATCAMIKRMFTEDRCLYITQSERLVRQAARDITGFLPNLKITQYGGGKHDKTGDIVISTSAMLWKHWPELIANKWINAFIAVLVDESHHASSNTLTQILLKLPCYFRLGCSDTRRLKNEGDMTKIRGLLGPTRYRVQVGTYIDLGRSATPRIYMVENPAWKNKFQQYTHQAEPNTKAWALLDSGWKEGTYLGPVCEIDEETGEIKTERKKVLAEEAEEVQVLGRNGVIETVKQAKWEVIDSPIIIEGLHQLKFPDSNDIFDVESTYCLLERAFDKAIITFKERNNLIVQWAKHYVKQRYPTLIVCTRTLHIYILEAMMKATLGADHVQILIGSHTSKERDRAFEWFRHTPGSVLISPLVQEGVSINEIRAGVIADVVSDHERANQIIGRFIRKKSGENRAEITWFMDNQHPSMLRACRAVFDKLINVRGYEFVRQVIGPDTISKGKLYKSLA
jgi:superfamily II DNA or RNA helicase